MKTVEDYYPEYLDDYIDAELLKEILEERDSEWKQKIQEAFNNTMNFHCKDVLKKLLEDK